MAYVVDCLPTTVHRFFILSLLKSIFSYSLPCKCKLVNWLYTIKNECDLLESSLLSCPAQPWISLQQQEPAIRSQPWWMCGKIVLIIMHSPKENNNFKLFPWLPFLSFLLKSQTCSCHVWDFSGESSLIVWLEWMFSSDFHAFKLNIMY